MLKLYSRFIQIILHLSMYFLPFTKPRLLEGQGSVSKTKDILLKNKKKNVLIITDKTIRKLNLEKTLIDSLKSADISYTIYDKTSVDPTIDNVEEAYKIYSEKSIEACIAIGGGSVIDCAKAVSAKAVKPKKPLYKMKGILRIRKRIPLLIAIPTTAGTGSEATAAAVIRNVEKMEKYAISDVSVIPQYAVLDPLLTKSLPKDYTAFTGMDALTHAIEAYIGRSRTHKTKKYALDAIKMINDNLVESYKNPDDLTVRNNMLKASFFAGLAFTRSFVGYIHAIAHTLGGLYHIPHGKANAIILPYVLKMYGKSIYKKMERISIALNIKGVTKKESYYNVINWILNLQEELNVDKHLKINIEDLETIVKRVQKETIPIYPVPKILSDHDVRKLLIDIKTTDEADYKEVIKLSKERFNKVPNPSYKQRIKKLKLLLRVIENYEDEIHECLKQDLGKHEFEAYTSEVSLVKSEINLLKRKLRKWMKPKKVGTPLVSIGATSKVTKQPKGVVLVFSPWNYPFQLTMIPLVSAIGAGNNVILKTSPYSSNTTRIMKKIITECFDPSQVYLIDTDLDNDIDIASDLLQSKFDHIFFTGSTRVGKIVYETAAKDLTPVTLELGGKNPVIVDKSANLKLTAMRIVWGKAINSGQTCIAPDYMLVENSVKSKLIQEIKNAINKFFNGDMIASDSYSSIINQTHFDRLNEYIKNNKIIIGGKSDNDKLKIELTLIDNPDLNNDVMQNEIFGPVLPVFGYDDMNEVYDIISHYKTPLALYLFTKETSQIKEVTKNISFGGGAINDVLMHFVSNKMPFGGIGNSGIGNYHGKYGFNTFTHEKSILKQTFAFDVPLRYAPFKKVVLKLVKLILK